MSEGVSEWGKGCCLSKKHVVIQKYIWIYHNEYIIERITFLWTLMSVGLSKFYISVRAPVLWSDFPISTQLQLTDNAWCWALPWQLWLYHLFLLACNVFQIKDVDRGWNMLIRPSGYPGGWTIRADGIRADGQSRQMDSPGRWTYKMPAPGGGWLCFMLFMLLQKCVLIVKNIL